LLKRYFGRDLTLAFETVGTSSLRPTPIIGLPLSAPSLVAEALKIFGGEIVK
jgi:hypothetical protein